MKKIIKYSVVALIILGSMFFALGYLSSFVGWYGYKKWRYRTASQSIKESKERRVFVKALHYKVEGYTGKLGNFEPFIEKGFKFGYHSSKETRPLENSAYPYQLSFNYRPDTILTVSIRNDQLIKFDSFNTSWGYLKEPTLPDTIILTINGENIQPGIVKVW